MPQPGVKNGIIDLRNWDFESGASVNLNGSWKWDNNSFVSPWVKETETASPAYINVPGKWPGNQTGFCTYRLCILLSPKDSGLALKLNDVATAYTLFANGKKMISVGIPGKTKESSLPQYTHPIIALPDVKDTLRLTIQVSNFYHYTGGILSPVSIGQYSQITKETARSKILGGMLIGAFLLAFIFHAILAFFNKKISYNFYFAAICLLFAIHYLILNERFLYQSMGAGYWPFITKLEFSTLLAAFLFLQLATECFLEFPVNKIFRWIGIVFFGGELAFVLVSPVFIASAITVLIPFNILLVFIYITTVSVIGYKRKREGSTTLIVFTLVIFTFYALYALLSKHAYVGGLLPPHYVFFLFIVNLSIIFARRSAVSYRKVQQLSTDLSLANRKLEQHNRDLENLVTAPTKQLVETQTKALALEMEKKQRDLEAVSANNKVKQQVSRKIILDLEKIYRSRDNEVKILLRKQVTSLKHQYSLDEKLNVFEQKLDKVNSDFMDRLHTRYPDLTKTEREICSLVKLNLSNKDMGILLKTSTNAVNVTRSRLRKKLGLTKEIDLDIFIRKI